MKIAVHTEALWRTREKLKVESKKHELVLFAITPTNYEYAVSSLGFRGSKKEFEEVLKNALRELSSTCEIQLHLHLSHFPSWISYEKQEKMFKYSEGFPLVLLEAMAMRVPCIATDVGGIPQIIPSEEFGFLHAPGDYKKMASLILRLKNDKKLLEGMKKASRKRVLENFTTEKVMKKYDEVYEKNGIF
jgi:glycosyltransferase involved in cell wall biosynthesis